MKFSLIISMVIGLTFVGESRGSVTLASSGAGVILDSSGTMVSLGSIGILVADLNNDGLADPLNTILSAGNAFSSDSNDLILGVYNAVDLNSGQNGFNFTGTTFTYSGNFAAGDQLWLVWFPTISTQGSTVTLGTSYGTFRTNSIDAMGTINWTAPIDGSNPQLFSLSASLGGNPAVSASNFTASFTAVPEPSVLGLIAVGAAGVLFFRRRHRC